MTLLVFGIAIFISGIALFFSFRTKEVPSCFSVEKFDQVANYVDWKKRTSKIGKVLVEGYEIELTPERTIVAKKKDYTYFSFSKEKGVVLLPVKQSKRMMNKANKVFCELVERERLHPVNPIN